MKDRIFKVMKWSGQNLSQFAEAIQVSPALLSSVKSERTKPTLLLIENIKRVYPEIDINWLITGEGEMLVGNAGGLLIAAEEKGKAPENKTDAKGETAQEADGVPGVETQKEVKPAPTRKREVVTVTPKSAEEPENEAEPTGRETKREPLRTVRQVLLMYNDGTYESFGKQD